jgi:hypothetical protein
MFPSISELLLNPLVAAAAVALIVNVISYAMGGENPSWLAVGVGLAYMLGGYIVTGRTTPDQLFTAVIYAFIAVAPLAHVDGAVLERLFGRYAIRTVSGNTKTLFPRWL